jgi:hypothetical protein
MQALLLVPILSRTDTVVDHHADAERLGFEAW